MHTVRPFDAGFAHGSEDQNGPRSEWRTVSLVYALRRLVEHRPDAPSQAPEARLEAFHAVADELTGRGVDAASLVRYGLAPETVGSIAAGLAIWRLFPNDPDLPSALGCDIEAWARALALTPVEGSGESAGAEVVKEVLLDSVKDVLPRLVPWQQTAPLEELVLLTPPTALPDVAHARAEPAEDVLYDYRWLVDRFSETFLREWSTQSLHREYRWSVQNMPPPCPEDLMTDRSVPKQDLTDEIARRAVAPAAQFGTTDPHRHQVSKSSDFARVLLAQERHRDASTLFEFALKQQPQDPEAMNNLGFCLIPHDPSEALFHLQSAAKLLYTPTAINIHNQMLCHLALGEHRIALRIADNYWDNRRESAPVNATLWEQSANSAWQLVSVPDARTAVAKLATCVASLCGLTAAEEKWLLRTV